MYLNFGYFILIWKILRNHARKFLGIFEKKGRNLCSSFRYLGKILGKILINSGKSFKFSVAWNKTQILRQIPPKNVFILRILIRKNCKIIISVFLRYFFCVFLSSWEGKTIPQNFFEPSYPPVPPYQNFGGVLNPPP